MYVYTYIHEYTHPYIHTHIHTYIHTYTHIYLGCPGKSEPCYGVGIVYVCDRDLYACMYVCVCMLVFLTTRHRV
jgi:hypothetical protein